jgi:hypothetical protein
MATRPAPADLIERLAGDMHALAFDMREPGTSVAQSDRLIEEAERISLAIRRVVRG